jgi:hypothetical protein
VAYVSKSGSRVEVRIHNEALYKQVLQGGGSAIFHECGSCRDVVIVTVEIAGEIFGALNANCIANKFGFPTAIETDFSSQTVAQKKERWRQNWCCPVRVNIQGKPSSAQSITC